MSPEFVVVGSYMQDLCFYAPEFPRPGETVVGRFAAGQGGKGSNQAVAAARAGANVGFIGAVGDDVFGDAAFAAWKQEGIATHVARKKGQPTGCAGIYINGAGENEIIIGAGANDHFKSSDLEGDWLTQARLVTAQLETPMRTTLAAFHLARSAGVKTLLNPAPMREDFDPLLLACTDLLIPNETEFVALLRLQGGAEEAAKALEEMDVDRLQKLARRLGPEVVILTLGARGCFVSTTDGGRFLPVCPGIEVVDTTGAGDAFVGGFAAGWIESGGNLEVALRWGTVTGGLSTTKPGTAAAMPTRDAIEAALKRLP